MFSSSNSVNPFLPSSFNHTPSFFGHNTDDINFLHHHHDLLVAHPSPANAPATDNLTNMLFSNSAAMSQQDIDRPDGDRYAGSSKFIGSCGRPVKKDRHSKIYTAQGLRDRRVRLSIQIASKFFDLQDMLGFDKASKTLEWLFAKSTTAIMELAQTKHRSSIGAKSLSSTSECEEVSGINEGVDNGDPQVTSKRKSLIRLSRKKLMKQSLGTASRLPAKEVRAKTRARARERTREKMCNRRLDELKSFLEASPHMLNQLRSSTQFETCGKTGSHSHEVEEPSFPSLTNQAERKYFIEEPIMIERKLKPSSVFGYQQNLVISKDVNSEEDNNNNNYLPNFPLDWSISNAVTRASFCAMTNMNLSTELQIFSKPWEIHNNQSPH